MLSLINPVPRAEPFDHSDWVMRSSLTVSGLRPTRFAAG
jgi:hypothetical protein